MIYIPGTLTPHVSSSGSVFSVFSQMITAAGGLTLAQVCSITGLENSTIQNWVKRKYVANTINKKYFEKHLARILIINALRDCMIIEQAVAILKYLNGDVEDEKDDAISEPQLFDYFCEVTKDLSVDGGMSREKIQSNIKAVIKDFKGPYTDSKTKLFNALETMCYAYAGSLYKREAELSFKLL